MSVFFLNDGGAGLINTGGINPPTIAQVTGGVVVPPIVANPVSGEAFFDPGGFDVTPLTAPGGGLTLRSLPNIGDDFTEISISGYEPFDRDLSTRQVQSLGNTTFSLFPFFFPFFQNPDDKSRINLPSNSSNDVSQSGEWLGTSRDDLLIAGPGDDLLMGLQGNDTLMGGEGNDTLLGGRGDDFLYGGDGNNILSGDRGSDTLTGGSGVNIFIVSPTAGAMEPNRADLITDFQVGQDQIALAGGLEESRINLIPFTRDDIPGTLLLNQADGISLGFLANVGVNDVSGSFITFAGF